MSSSGAEFDAFYAAHFRSTVKMTYGLTADLPEAHDIAQEAFCRAWSRWRELSGFDNPAAWVRKVAVNLARSRWRRLRVAAEYLVRERPEHVAALDAEHVAVVAALRKLPSAQREAIVLHYLADLPLAEVAEQMSAPVGTVKSWLHRGRSALAEDLRVDLDGAVVAPGAEQVFKTMKNRHRVRTTAALVLVMVLVFGAVALAQNAQRHPDPSPIESPTPVPSSTKDDPMAAVDWSHAGVEFRLPNATCPSGKVALEPIEGGAGRLDTYPGVTVRPAEVALGDLDGDGWSEAVLPGFCRASPESDDVAQILFVVKRLADGTLTVVTGTDNRRTIAQHVWITGRVVYVDVTPRDSVGGKRHLGEVEGWRWNGNALQPVDTSHGYPLIDVLNLSPVASELPCRPAAAELRPRFGADLRARAGGRVFSLESSEYKQVYATFGREGRPYLVLGIACGTGSADGPPSVVVFDRVDGEWRAVDLLPADAGWDLAGDRVTVGRASYTWQAGALVRTG